MRWWIVLAAFAVAAAVLLLWDRDESGSVDDEPTRGQQSGIDAPPVLTGGGRTPGPASSRAPASGGESPNEAVARLIVRVTQGLADTPLAGADVRILEATGQQETLRTPATGAVEIVRREAARLIVFVTHAGLVPSSPQDVTLDVGKTKTVVIRMNTGIGVRGVVLRAEDGSPLAGARVAAMDGGSVGTLASSTSHRPLGVALTDSDGRFRFAALPPEAVCTVIVRAAGFAAAKQSFLPKDVTGREDGIVFRLEPGARLVGRVYAPDGKPVAGARIRLDGKNELMAVSDADGAYVIDGLQFDQRYSAVARARGFASSRKAEDVFATTGSPEIVLDLTLRRPSALRVSLLDQAEQPIETDEANLWLGPFPSGWRGRPDGSVPGAWRFDGVAPGSHRLAIKVPGYVVKELRVTIPDGGASEEVVTLQAGTTISGLVVDDRGEAMGGVRVKAGIGFPAPVAAQVRTDDKGRFRLGGLKGGPYRVAAARPNHETVSLENVHVGTTDLRIVLLRPAKVIFRLRLPPGTPPPDRISVHALRSDGRNWKDGGAYEAYVASGHSRFVVSGKGFAQWSTELDLEPGEEVDLGTIAAQPGVTLQVRVIDRAGRAVPDAEVSIIEDLDSWRVFAPPRTGAEGTCKMPHLILGVHELAVQADGFLRHKQRVEVPAGGTSVTLTLEAGGLVRGVILTATGVPAKHVPVHLYPLDEANARQDYWSHNTGERGRFERRIPAGRYRVDVMTKEKDRVLASTVIAVPEGGTKPFELRLDR